MRLRGLTRFRSFGLRIAVLSCFVSGVALAFFGGLTFAAMQRLSLRRMDQQIKEFAHRPLVEHQDSLEWERVGSALRFFLEGDDENTFILLVKGPEGTIQFQSPNWPSDLPATAIPAPDAWGEYPPGMPPGTPSIFPPDENVVSQRAGGPGPPSGRQVPPVRLKTPEFSTRGAGGAAWRIGLMGTSDVTVALGLNMERLNAEMVPIRRVWLTVLPIALLLVALGAWWLSQRALKPIQAVTDTIQRVKARGLNQRISVQEGDREFFELITVFNEMMDWLEKSFHQATRFSADASHELRTPLTVLQAQLEQAVQEAAPDSDERRRYVAFGKELQRLKSITQKLLLLARIDAGELRLNLRPLDLSELVEGAVEDTETLAPQLRVEHNVTPDLSVMGDDVLMKQVIQNLASNAVKFNREGGFIRFDLEGDGGNVRLVVTNSGPGIPPESYEDVFTRFYRGDKAHSRRIGGAGLGLSLAREIVRAHNGALLLEESSGDTTAFSVQLPGARA